MHLRPATTWPMFCGQIPLTRRHLQICETLYRLRRALPDADRFLLVDDQTLQWRADAPFTFDVIDFESAIARSKQAALIVDRGALRSALEGAVGLYQGDLLPSCYDDWIIMER